MSKKNILLITTDQQNATMASCTGNRDLHTPNMDSLAADGIRFEKAYAAQPLCIPQRCSWYTGLMPHEHGLNFNIRDKVITSDYMMGQIFRDEGYATGYSGKWHINIPEDEKEPHGFEWMNNIRCNGADAGITPDFEEFLKQKGDRPFIFSASFNNPHNICEAARGMGFPDGEPGIPENLEQLPALPGNFSVPEKEPSVIREVQEIFREKNYPTSNWDEYRWKLHRWHYCRITEILDNRIGKLLDVLKKTGHWDDTMIVFTSDHGDGNSHHHWNQKQVLYDESARVPFFVTKPGSEIQEVNEKQLVNTGIDLIPTLCGLAEIDCPKSLKGIDWSDMLRTSDIPLKRDHVIVETEFGNFNQPLHYKGRAVRTENYKYMIYDRGENREFLVDMVNDPGEMKNLTDDPKHKTELEQHRAFLRNYIIRSEDIFPLELVPE